MHSLEVTFQKNINADTVAHPIANIVVPHGTPVSLIVQIGSTLSGTSSEVYTFGQEPPPPRLSLTTTPTHVVAAAVTVTGSQATGYTPAFAVIPPAEQVTGSLVVNGFQTGDTEIYAVDVLSNGTQATGAALAVIISELQSIASPIGTTVSAVTDPRIAALFPSANLQITGADPQDLNWDLSFDTTLNPTFISIGVVPEPSGIALLPIGGLGLLSRRRRRGVAKCLIS